MSLKPTLFPARTALVLLASSGMVACSSLNEMGKVDYRSQAAAQTRPLDIPPDLSQLARDTRYAMPGGPVTASSVSCKVSSMPFHRNGRLRVSTKATCRTTTTAIISSARSNICRRTSTRTYEPESK